MRITICELSDKAKRFKKEWEKLVHHVNKKKSDLVLLNELPFGKWIATSNEVDEDLKAESFALHKSWSKRIPEMKNAIVVYSKPEFIGGKFYNTAFVWTKENGHVPIHTKYFFPEEENFYEESWYDRKQKKFKIAKVRGVKIGVLLCSELWFTSHARTYGKNGADLLLCPRATGRSSSDSWMRCGQTVAVISGAFCLSSNRAGAGSSDFEWGGRGWIARPGDGELLAQTSSKQSFVTVEIDLDLSKKAKKEYPLYIKK